SFPVRFLDNIDVGHSGTWGSFSDDGKQAVYGYAFDLLAKRGPWELAAEYMNLRFEQPASAPPTDPRRMDGWYVEIRYHFFPPGWRGKHPLFTDESTFTLVVRWEGLDLNHSTRGTTFRDDLEQLTVGFNFRPIERTVFKISYTFVDSENPAFDGGAADIFAFSVATFF
ncbi:MAG: hypothetical protein ACE5JG_12535, partial [Planctomycetota bacterium]